jgi:glycerol kinase
MNWDERCNNINTDGLFVTGFSGIAAPYWVSGFEDIYHNINKKDKNEVIRAGMESIGFLANDIIDMLNNNISFDSPLITASGGGARNSLLQFISDLTGQIISRPKIRDKTATGVFRILNSNYTTKQSDDSTLFKPIKDRKKIMHKIKKWREIASSLD